MSIKQIDVATALNSLGILNTFVSGVPTNDKELIYMTKRQDANGNEIALGVSWTEVNNEITKLKNINTKKINDAKKGNDKLLSLGLTQDEATALTGYKPKESE